MSATTWGLGLDCPRCHQHHYGELPIDLSPVRFTCMRCGWTGWIRLNPDWTVTFTEKETPDAP